MVNQWALARDRDITVTETLETTRKHPINVSKAALDPMPLKKFKTCLLINTITELSTW